MVVIQIANTDKKVSINRQALIDLDFIEVVSYFVSTDGITTDERTEWIAKYLTFDPQEILTRNGLLLALGEIPDILETLEEVHKLALDIKKNRRLMKVNKGALYYCTYYINAIGLCLQSLNLLVSNLEGFDNPALDGLKSYLSGITSSAKFTELSTKYKKLKSTFVPLKNVSFIVNYTQNGEIDTLIVSEVNGTDADAGLFTPESGEPSSFFDPVHALKSKRRELLPMEAHILKKAEQKMLPNLLKTRIELSKINDSFLDEWLDFCEPVELYISGLKYMNILRGKGCAFCTTELSGSETVAEGLRYPHYLLQNGTPPVPNDMSIHSPSSAVITGPNSSGKTSVIKTLAQGILLAQLGFPVPATRFILKPVSKVLTLFSMGEDGSMFSSRFQQESKIAHSLIAEANENTLCLLNEPFTSTYPSEAIGLICDIAEKLAAREPVLLIVTHFYDVYFELLSRGNTETGSYIMRSRPSSGTVKHEYKLVKALPDKVSFAQIIAEQYGLNARGFIENPALADDISTYLSRS